MVTDLMYTGHGDGCTFNGDWTNLGIYLMQQLWVKWFVVIGEVLV